MFLRQAVNLLLHTEVYVFFIPYTPRVARIDEKEEIIMMNKRIFIQKKSNFDIHSQKVTNELQNLVAGIECKVFVIYDLFSIEDAQLESTLYKVFADPVTDLVYQDLSSLLNQFQNATYFASEPLPGQYDQRADSADQCLHLMGVVEPKVKSGYLYVFEAVSESNLSKIKSYLINPIESREKDLSQLVLSESTQIKPVPTIDDSLTLMKNN